LLNSVKKLDKINDIEIQLEGNIKEIIENPINWAEKQAEKFIIKNQDKYFEAKKLGEEFWSDIRDKS
tara:strand:- start:865 stop:1065 length:201 start_codon:yes stop_codon:yes gene_type:complete